MAGGNTPIQGRGGEAKFHTVPWASQGDLGSKVLKKGQATANYTAGSTVEMSWAIRYNHGGGCEPLPPFAPAYAVGLGVARLRVLSCASQISTDCAQHLSH